MIINEIVRVIVFGIVEGLTEWLPISSTGHLILAGEILPLNQPKAYMDMFQMVIQLGAILAVAVMYFHKLNPFSPTKNAVQKKDTLTLWLKILLACVPAGVIGILFDDLVDEYLMNGIVVSATLIIYGVLFIAIEVFNRNRRFKIRHVNDIPFDTALYIGLFQLLAMIPGTSRSGTTILGAMLIGCSRSASAEFSFFLAIPVMFGMSFIKLVKYGVQFTAPQVGYLILGMAVSFIVSVYAIRFLMDFIRKHDFKFFGYYRIVLGILFFLLVYRGMITVQP